MEKQKLEQHLFHNKLNYLEKIILFIFLNQNNIKINIYDIEKFFLLKKRENTIVGFYSDFYISNLLKIKNNLIFEDTISFLINKIIYLDYSISIENELINPLNPMISLLSRRKYFASTLLKIFFNPCSQL